MGKFQEKHSASRKFTVKLSNGKDVLMKNYQNAFQKRLLAANINEDNTVIFNEILCALDENILDNDIKANELAYFDVEKLFVGLYANSNADKLGITITCNTEVEKEFIDEETKEKKLVKAPCGEKIKSRLNLNLCQVEDYKELVYDVPGFKINLRYPNFIEYLKLFEMLKDQDNKDKSKKIKKFEYYSKLINDCITTIVDENGTYDFNTEMDEEDQLIVIESISPQLIVEIITDLMKPNLISTIPFKCPKCGKNEPIKLKGINNFFG